MTGVDVHVCVSSKKIDRGFTMSVRTTAGSLYFSMHPIASRKGSKHHQTAIPTENRGQFSTNPGLFRQLQTVKTYTDCKDSI